MMNYLVITTFYHIHFPTLVSEAASTKTMCNLKILNDQFIVTLHPFLQVKLKVLGSSVYFNFKRSLGFDARYATH